MISVLLMQKCELYAMKVVNPNPYENQDGNDTDDDVNPNDNISNVGSKCSSLNCDKLSTTSSSSSSARVKVMADRAALVACVTTLKEKHALEEQEQHLRGKKGAARFGS